MPEPLVSVIVTCHNQERWLAKTVESVLTQSHRNLECLIVDDGSTDSSQQLAKKLSTTDSRVQFISQENKGVAVARNTGFAASNGDYVQFLDGDDTLEPTKFELQLEQLSNRPDVDASYTSHRYYHVSESRFATYEFKRLSESPFHELLFGWHNGVSVPVHAPLYRRRIWGESELPYRTDYRHRCEDWVFLVLLAKRGSKFCFLDKPLCNYHLYGENFTSNIGASCSAAIHAGFFLAEELNEPLRSEFLSSVIERTLKRYHEAKKPEVLYQSQNWQLGNFLTKPFFMIRRSGRELLSKRRAGG